MFRQLEVCLLKKRYLRDTSFILKTRSYGDSCKTLLAAPSRVSNPSSPLNYKIVVVLFQLVFVGEQIWRTLLQASAMLWVARGVPVADQVSRSWLKESEVFPYAFVYTARIPVGAWIVEGLPLMSKSNWASRDGVSHLRTPLFVHFKFWVGAVELRLILPQFKPDWLLWLAPSANGGSAAAGSSYRYISQLSYTPHLNIIIFRPHQLLPF